MEVGTIWGNIAIPSDYGSRSGHNHVISLLYGFVRNKHAGPLGVHWINGLDHFFIRRQHVSTRFEHRKRGHFASRSEHLQN